MLRRTCLQIVCLVILSPIVSPILSPVVSAQDRPAPSLIPDPNWRPKVGDRVTVRQPGTAGLPDRATCERYIRLLNAGDTDGMQQMGAARGAFPVPADTAVLVIEPHGLPRPASGPASSPENLNADIQDAINRAASRPKPLVSIEARILDGPLKGRTAFIPAESLARMIPAPATAGIRVGDKMTVAAKWIPMGDDEEQLIWYIREPNKGDSRDHVLPLNKGATITVLSVGRWSCRVKVTGRSRHAGKVGFIKGDGLEVAKQAAAK